MKNILFIVLLIIATSTIAQEIPNEQKLPNSEFQIIPPSPNASAILAVENLKLNNYTGVPNIDIPLLTIKLNQIEYPISMQYNSSGLKVEDRGSNIGLGWTINGIGMVSRVLRGLPDEMHSNYLHGQGRQGFFSKNARRAFRRPDGTYSDMPQFNELYTCEGSWADDPFPPNQVGMPDFPVTYTDSLAMSYIDTQPDLFSYVLPLSKTSKFTFDHSRNILEYEKDDIVILEHPFDQDISKLDYNSSTKWKIRDEKGIVYTFESLEITRALISKIQYSETIINPDLIWYTSTWYLTSIEVNNEWINFEYQPETHQYDWQLSESAKFLVEGTGVANNTSETISETTIDAQRLSKITTSNGYEIDFIESNNSRPDLQGSKAIEKIVIKRDGATIEKIHLLQSTFNGNSQRLKLDGARSSRNGLDYYNIYSFNYNDGILPDFESNDRDYWGYYNGANNPFATLMPRYHDQYYYVNHFNGIDKDPNPEFAKVGILNTITYPTGGSIKLAYSGNRYFKKDALVEKIVSVTAGSDAIAYSGSFDVNKLSYGTFIVQGAGMSKIQKLIEGSWTDVLLDDQMIGNRKLLPQGTYRLVALGDLGSSITNTIYYDEPTDKNVIAGGLRVSSIDYINDDNQISKREMYSYNGKLPTSPFKLDESFNSSGKLFSPPIYSYTTITIAAPEGEIACTDEGRYLNLTTNPAQSLLLISGSHLGYSEVIKQEVDWINPTKNINGYTKFFYINDIDQFSTEFPFVPPPDLAFKNGKIEKEEYYDSNNSLVKEVVNEYQEITGNKQVFGYVMAQLNAYQCYRCDLDDFGHRTYSVQSKRFDLMKTTTKNYFGENYISDVVEYSYNNLQNNQLSSLTYINEKGQSVTKNYQRVSDKPALLSSYTNSIDGLITSSRIFSYNGISLESLKELNTENILEIQQIDPLVDLSQYYELKTLNKFGSNNEIITNIKNPSVSLNEGGEVNQVLYNSNFTITSHLISNKEQDFVYFNFEDYIEYQKFLIDLNSLSTNDPFTGKGNYKGEIRINDINAGVYELLFWEKNSSSSSNTNLSFEGSTFKSLEKVNQTLGYSLYKLKFDFANNSSLIIKTNNSYIDDFMMYPQNSILTGYVISNENGIEAILKNSLPSIFIYDHRKRLHKILEHKQNILQQFDYNYITE